MADLTVVVLLGAAFAAVLTVAAGIPDRICDWVDARWLAHRVWACPSCGGPTYGPTPGGPCWPCEEIRP